MEECIAQAKKIIKSQVEKNKIIYESAAQFSEYSKFYLFTNENISAYLDLVQFEGKTSALSVLASGDKTFNLISKGITDIDTFDINRLTEYYALGLKRAMILKYSYEGFMKTIERLRHPHTSIDEITEIIKSLFPYMEEKHKLFWHEILEYNYGLQKTQNTSLNLILMLSLAGYDLLLWINYLKNEENYVNLRKRLASANISFKQCDAISLNQEFHSQYDFILLSNIMDYFDKEWGIGWEYNKLKLYEESLQELMKPDGVIFLHYLIGYVKNGLVTLDSHTKFSDLTDEEIHLIISPFSGFKRDGIILKRIKK